ncbi:cytochrome P450 [Methylosinus sp. R-45379]|uniref:cytochrome P450 n=1 Tax=Methylosinus sp. R-45379 TaxID=980563 RepID=UPI0007C89799|nr:cytochrome P450 [Methylosinus sp. R-45379]OAI28082.1 cytochrome P450 [Methylosinus sp. R-45379]
MFRRFSDLPAFQRDALGFFLEKGANATAPLVELKVGFDPVYLVADPTTAKAVLKADEAVLDKGKLIWKLREVIGRSMLTISGPEHRQRREAVHREFAQGVGGPYVPIMCSAITEWIAEMVRAGEFEAHKATATLALRIIASLVFGKGVLTPDDERAMTEAVALAEDDLAAKVFQVLPDLPWNYVRKKRKLAAARATMAEIVEKTRRRASDASLIRTYERIGLDDETMRDEILLMLLAGHHTSGTAMAWTLYHIAIDPAIASRLAEEAREVVTDTGELTASSIRRAPVSKAFVQEVVRLYPSTYYMSRETKCEHEVGGVRLRKGTSLVISPWQYHRDPRYWVRPETFDMDREFAGDHYMPFGVGPRACVGLSVAMLELQLLALDFAAALEATVTTQIPAPPPKPVITLVPPSIGMRVRPRGLPTAERKNAA